MFRGRQARCLRARSGPIRAVGSWLECWPEDQNSVFFAIRISSASHRPLVHPRRSHPLQPVERKCGLMSLSFVRQVAGTDKRPRSARRRSAPSPRRISRGIFHLVSRREGKARQGLKFPRSSRRYRSLPSSPVQCSLNKPPRYPARSSRSLALSMGRRKDGQKLPRPRCPLCLPFRG